MRTAVFRLVLAAALIAAAIYQFQAGRMVLAALAAVLSVVLLLLGLIAFNRLRTADPAAAPVLDAEPAPVPRRRALVGADNPAALGEAPQPAGEPPLAAERPAPAEPAPLPADGPGFAALYRTLARPGLALYRPYPPGDPAAVRSHMGGRPSLPAGTTWPRARTGKGCMPEGTPLHFLAQIDLAEQPWLPDHCPARGTLLFFGMVPAEEGYYWTTPEDSRVLFDPDSAGVPTDPPRDLLPPDKAHDGNRLFGEDPWPQACLYPHWPLLGRQIDTMPDAGALSDAHLGSGGWESYDQALGEFRANQAAAAFGLDLSQLAAHEVPGADSLRADPDFPFVSGFVALWARAVRHQHPDAPDDLRALADQWLAWAAARRPGDPVRGEAAAEFAALYDAWPWPERAYYTRDTVLVAIAKRLVGESGGDPHLARHLPRAFFELVLEDHAMVWPRRWSRTHSDGSIAWAVQHHQMGGHVPSTQGPVDLDYARACLLQLRTDYGADMMLCDVGECDFWIRPDDLARADFSDVEGDTRGG